MNMHASELRKFSHFRILKLLFPSIFCWYCRLLCHMQKHTFSGLKLHLHTYIYDQCSFLILLMHVWRYIYTRQYTDKKLTLRTFVNMRASGVSELRKFSHFQILKLLFLSIFCWYFRYFVGTNDMLVGSHVPTNFQMYRQNSEKALLGGGGSCPPPPPPLATLVLPSVSNNYMNWNLIWKYWRHLGDVFFLNIQAFVAIVR